MTCSHSNHHPCTQTNHFAQQAACCTLPIPNFIHQCLVVNYDHLPQVAISLYQNGTLADHIGWVLLYPDLKHQVKVHTSHIPDAQIFIRLYCSLGDIAVHHTEVHRCMHTTIDPTSAIIYHIVQTAQDEAISAAQRIMDLKLTTGPMAKALGDLLPYQDQHDPTCILKTKLHLA